MYGYGYRYNSGLVIGAGGVAPFANTKSLSFDGMDDYVSCGSASYLNGLTEFSISGWFNLTTAANNKCILSDWVYNVAPFGHFSLRTTGTSGTSFKLQLFIKAPTDLGSLYVETQSTVCTEATWYNVTSTYNSGVCKIYVNGIEAPIFIFGTIPTTLTTQDGSLNIGKWEGVGQNWNGNIDEVSIYNYALTSAEALAIGGTIPTDLSLLSTPPLHWYRNGDNDTYPTIADVGSLASNPGTMGNMGAGDIVLDVPL